MRGTFDPAADAAYIYLVDPIAPGQSKRQVVADAEGLRATLVLDLDEEGRLLGIEILGAAAVLCPDTLAIFNSPSE